MDVSDHYWRDGKRPSAAFDISSALHRSALTLIDAGELRQLSSGLDAPAINGTRLGPSSTPKS